MEQETDGRRVSSGDDADRQDESLTVEVVPSIKEIPEEAWNALLGEGDEASPFLEWNFLAALEDAQTLGEDNGWIPQIPVVRHGDRIVAAAPAYVKLHSMGEFVFDWSWAQLAERMGKRYYPKLLVGVPFTPVTGRRLLTAPNTNRELLVHVLGQLLVEICEQAQLSGVHVNFAQEDEIGALEQLGYLRREGIQYHWKRHDGTCFDDYLGRFNSKRRNQLKRERRALEKENIVVENKQGHTLSEEECRLAFEIYESTVDKFYWGQKYLNEDVFHLWRERMGHAMEVVTAKRDGELLAGAINFAKGRRLYGRYWGCFKEVKHLHFNVCYYNGIAECFDRSLDVFEPGAGGEHKLVRGFEPTLQHSAHFLVDEQLRGMIERYLFMERLETRRSREMRQQAMGTKPTQD